MPLPQSRLRYLQADFLNLQRNTAREKEQTRDFAITRFAGDLLETVDVLALALKSVPRSALPSESSSPESPDVASSSSLSSPPSSSSSSSSDSKPASVHLQELHKGVEMTHRLLLQYFFIWQSSLMTRWLQVRPERARGAVSGTYTR